MGEVSTDDAVEHLHQMFEEYDRGSLAAVLQANGGHMERTIEHLLSSPGENVPVGNSETVAPRPPPGTDHDAALALQLSREWADDPAAGPPPPTIPQGIPGPFDDRQSPERGGTGGAILCN
ncbi:unnamed protein product [Discosporangium mesarthrocarpum]